MRAETPLRPPWTCRFARLAGAVRSSDSVESSDVFWTCHLRKLSSSEPLFPREECEDCRRWEPVAGCASCGDAPPAFQKLVPEDGLRSAAVARLYRYARGDTIFQEGQPSDFFYTIAGGNVKLSKATPFGKDVIIDIFGPGEPVGADAAYAGCRSPASAVALDENTTCVGVPYRRFCALLDQQPSLARALLAGVTQRLEEVMNRIVDMTGGHMEPRVARLFLKLADDMGRKERGGIFIPLSLSRQDLADLAGTTIETCIRIMSRWGKRNIVRTEKNGFRITDRKVLQILAYADLSGP